MAVKGCIRIETRPTQGDESGIYRITESKHGYLMLAFEEQDEARDVAKVIAKALGVPYKDHFYTETKLTGAFSGHMPGATIHKPGASIESNTPKSLSIDVSVPVGAVRPKPKKVMGAVVNCRKLLSVGVPEAEALAGILKLYLDAGHTAGSAKNYAAGVMKLAKQAP